MEDFIKRLRSFKLTTWMCKPKELSPVECAKRGYVNTSKDTIFCIHCGAYFNTSIYYECDLLQMHSEYCQLSIPIKLSYTSVPEFSTQAYRERESSYSNMDVLPCILYPLDEINHQDLLKVFPQFPKVYLKSIFALFGWARGYNRVYCEMCGIVIECSRKEYELIKARNIYNLLVENKTEGKMSLRHGVEITVGKQVDLINSHRYYCPWVNDITVEDYSYFTNNSNSENVGWRILYKELLLRD